MTSTPEMLIKKRINFLCFLDFKQIPPVGYSTDRSKAVVLVLV